MTDQPETPTPDIHFMRIGDGSPEGFYRKLGFTPTGDYYGHEIELVLSVDDYILP